MKIVLIDNYDSFTYNLARYLRDATDVHLTLLTHDDPRARHLDSFDKIVISPGPGLPMSSGYIVEVIQAYSGKKPILGICLGMQAVFEAFGGSLYNLPSVCHGVSSLIYKLDEEESLFRGIHSPFMAGRYHSWVCDPSTLPSVIRITAEDDQGTIMACRHRTHETMGVQFHPESILTPDGSQMIRNFITG